ncbi:outer membrane beta-barrel protein [Larkinella rosea]|uniref:PorT family protein n=1 Tax=Larkinella rosea TaxID=2025312 RepID=A0A3P1BDA5_9BACT|nr:outer membrane beta-barrel protein [Larkinella rosea]RRA98875.1 PorT family protein [Larkinella rosea]
MTMNRIGSVLSMVLLIVTGQQAVFAQKTASYRWEISAGGNTLQSSEVSSTGWLIRQQVTYFPLKHIGISAGAGWGKMENLTPLTTITDQKELLKLFYRQYNTTELNAVWAPIRGRRHTLRLTAGLAMWRLRAMNVDSVISSSPRWQQAEIVPDFVDSRRLIPQIGLGYQVNITPRWLLGVDARAYRVGARKTATTLGLTAAYRFHLNADSLGLTKLNWQDLKIGVRLGATYSAGNGQSNYGSYRARMIAGLWAELPISLTWSARGEISYAQRGYRIREYKRGNMRLLPAVSSQSFLDWTILFSHEIAYRWRLLMGPQLAIFLNGREELDGKPAPVRPRHFSGVVFGTSVQLSDRLQIDGRYQRDILSFSTNQGGGLHGFQLGMSYSLNY